MYPIYLKAMTEFDSGFDSLRGYYKSLLRAILDELCEFLAEPSIDEFSDILHGTSRLIKGAYCFHYLVGGTAPNKLVKRYLEYGSIRSKRNLGRR